MNGLGRVKNLNSKYTGAVMLKLKIIKHGSSAAIILPEVVMARLNVTEGDPLYLTEVRGGYKVTANDRELRRQTKLAAQIMKRDREILRALSDL